MDCPHTWVRYSTPPSNMPAKPAKNAVAEATASANEGTLSIGSSMAGTACRVERKTAIASMTAATANQLSTCPEVQPSPVP